MQGVPVGVSAWAPLVPCSPRPLPSASPPPETPFAPRLAHCWPGLVPGPESDGEAVLTSRRGSCLGVGCRNVPGQWD